MTSNDDIRNYLKQYILDQEEHEEKKRNARKKPSVSLCVAHYNESLDWLQYIKIPFTVISKKGIPIDTAINKGNEASAYFQYIISNYDVLTDYTIFVHGHRTSHHLIRNIDDMIQDMVFDRDYYNFNDAPKYSLCGFPLSFKAMSDNIDELNSILSTNLRVCDIIYKTSAMFYVSKESIRRHPKEVYIKLLDFIYNHQTLKSFYTSRLFEFIHHFIFTGDAVDKS